MNKKNLLIIFVLIVISGITAYFYEKREVRHLKGNELVVRVADEYEKTVADIEEDKKLILSQPKTDWKVYENILYKYRVKYPKIVEVQKTQEEERASNEESFEVDFFIPGDRGTIHIMIWKAYDFPVSDKEGVERNRLAGLDPKSFSEALRQKEIDDKNPYFPNKKVGLLQEITFAGEKAYSYVVTGSADAFGDSDDTYILVEHRGVKLEIFYPHQDKFFSEILNTFEFVQ